MTAAMEETPTSSETKEALIEQITSRREEQKNAVQERKTNEIHVRQYAEDSEQVGAGSEGEEEADDREQEEKGTSFQFTLGDEIFDVDENAEFEFKADGKSVRMTLREMRDAAAGGVAVRNRMRALSEERKKLFTPYKDFSKVASSDPLNALKRVFTSIKQVDPGADLNTFLRALGKQAQSLTQMSTSEREAYQLKRELDETRETLTESERIAKIQEWKQELIGEMGLTEQQVYAWSQKILSDPILGSDIENEEDLFDRVEAFADEVQRQQAVIAALHEYQPNLPANDPLVFELSDLLKQNPDFTEADLKEVAEGVLNGVKRTKASKALSKRQRSNVIRGHRSPQLQDFSKMPPKDALKAQLLAKRNSQQSK